MRRMGMIVLAVTISGLMAGAAFSEEEPAVVSVAVSPDVAEVAIGEEVAFTVETTGEDGQPVEAEVVWSVDDEELGVIDQNGAFTALKAGIVEVTATAGELSGTAIVTIVEDEEPVDPIQHRAEIYRMKGDKLTKFGSGVISGDTLTIGGLSHPLNFLNGMKIYFPEGSLTENIAITFTAPKFARIGKNEIDFENGIVTGVTFEVKVGDDVVSPYYFGVPLEVSLPYKRGLLTKLGIAPEDLGMYFAADSGELEPDQGITDIVVDEENNRITGKIAHFSNIVAAPKSMAPSMVKGDAPTTFALFQNTPNPFNPSTSISFSIQAEGIAKLSIYNIVGQEVRRLADGHFSAGVHTVTWDGRDHAGRAVTSGVYFYRLEAGMASATKKLMLLK